MSGEIEKQKCPECPPGLPGWMATFSDLVTLLLTFFVLLLSFAKTESAKYEAALGSIRNAFGGNVLKMGEVIERGKSPDDSPTMMESQQPVRPFPVEFLTMEGILDKHEINRASDEDLKVMRQDLRDHELAENVTVYEEMEGIKVHVKEKIYFKEGSTVPEEISVEVYDKVIDLLNNSNWTIYVIGHSSKGEVSDDGKLDAFELSAARASAVTRSLIKRGVNPSRVTTVFYGDNKPEKILGNVDKSDPRFQRRVEFIIRKRDFMAPGHKVDSQ
jgi:chemotaxis protein MotB